MINLRLLFLSALAAASFTVLSVDNRTQITLQVLPESSVGDLFRVEKNGYTGLHIPLAPELTQRRFWQAVPKGMKNYPALYQTSAGTLTTGSMLRFFKRSHELFEHNSLGQKAYKTALADCIKAHKVWFKTQTKENLDKLHESSDKVLKLLDTLSFSNPLVRYYLADILSTPERGIFSNALNWFFLGKRSTVEAHLGQEGETLHAVVVPNQQWKVTSLLLQAFKLAIPAHVISSPLAPKSARGNAGLLGLASIALCFNSWRSDHNLTAEPGEGITVKIEFYEGPSSDNSRTSNF